MSYCQHDIHCPGHGPAHDAALAHQTPLVAPPAARNADKDRSLSGKKRRKARRERGQA